PRCIDATAGVGSRGGNVAKAWPTAVRSVRFVGIGNAESYNAPVRPDEPRSETRAVDATGLDAAPNRRRSTRRVHARTEVRIGGPSDRAASKGGEENRGAPRC